jgi:hypothetical protein
MAAKTAAIPEPISDINSVRNTAAALKENVEIMQGIRGDRTMAAVTYQDLLRLGLITAAQLPRTPTSGG